MKQELNKAGLRAAKKEWKRAYNVKVIPEWETSMLEHCLGAYQQSIQAGGEPTELHITDMTGKKHILPYEPVSGASQGSDLRNPSIGVAGSPVVQAGGDVGYYQKKVREVKTKLFNTEMQQPVMITADVQKIFGYCYDALTEVQTALSAINGQEWLPIDEDALFYKDFLVYDGEIKIAQKVHEKGDSYNWYSMENATYEADIVGGSVSAGVIKPTHFMYLPTPPKKD